MRPLSPILACLLLAVCAAAEAADVARLRGGGAEHTDCMLVTDVVAAARSAHGRGLRCTDGDPTCDADAATNGVCTLTARMCLNDPTAPRCRPEPLAHATLVAPAPALSALATALGALAMPANAPDTCTPMLAVPVATRGRHLGRVVLRATATMASGPTDRDRVSLVCRPAAPPVTLATIQRRVFTPSCASLSCHGAARAGGLDLSPAGAATSLIGVPPSNANARSAGLVRVVPGDPEGSFLVRKLAGSLAPGEGARMPQVGGVLPPTKIELVRRWIAGL